LAEPETRVWLVRHAETATPNLFHGAESDVGLSERGKQQASAAAEWFRPLEPTAVVSSAMRRAVDTAAPIAAACGVPHSINPAFHERFVGALSGTTFSASDGPWSETLRRWQAGETSYATAGAESFDAIRARVLPAWGRLVATHPGGRVVLVAHGVVSKVLLFSLLPTLSVADWTAVGKWRNLAVSALVHPPGGPWRAESLLAVPDPVRALSGGPAGSAA
jgi:broad specificity phosphatase PhoE